MAAAVVVAGAALVVKEHSTEQEAVEMAVVGAVDCDDGDGG